MCWRYSRRASPPARSYARFSRDWGCAARPDSTRKSMSHILFYYHWAAHGSPRYYHEAFEALGHEVTWCGTSTAWDHPGYQADLDVAALYAHLANEGRPPDVFIYCG